MKTEHTILSTKKIPEDKWADFFDQLTEMRKNSCLSLEVASQDLGNATIVKEGTLSSITFDPVGKGNNLEISIGGDEVLLSHFVSGPKMVWAGEGEDQTIVALEVIDEADTQTIVKFVD